MSWWLTPQPASRNEPASAARANARRLISRRKSKGPSASRRCAGLPSCSVSRGFQALFVACLLIASTASSRSQRAASSIERRSSRACRPVPRSRASSGRRSSHPPAATTPAPTPGSRSASASPGPLVAWVVSPQGAVVQKIADFKDVRRVHLTWNGKNDAGTLAPDGSYRLRLHIARSRRPLRCSSSWTRSHRPSRSRSHPGG